MYRYDKTVNSEVFLTNQEKSMPRSEVRQKIFGII